MKQDSNVVVTGANGFIGSHLCKQLIDEGYKVFGIGRGENGQFSDSNYVYLSLDLADTQKLIELFKGIKIKYFFHLAHNGVNGAVKSDYRVQLENTMITCNIVSALSKLRCERFIYAASVDEFQAFNKPDDYYTRPNNARIYAIAKYASEQICKDICFMAGLEYVSVINPMVYGRGNKTNILPNVIIKNSLCGLPVLLIEGNNKFDLIHVNDCVAAFINVAQKGINMESYYSGHRSITTFKEKVLHICEALELEADLRFGQYPDNPPEFNYDLIDLDKAYRDTGYQCINDGVDSWMDTYQYIKENIENKE